MNTLLKTTFILILITFTVCQTTTATPDMPTCDSSKLETLISEWKSATVRTECAPLLRLVSSMDAQTQKDLLDNYNSNSNMDQCFDQSKGGIVERMRKFTANSTAETSNMNTNEIKSRAKNIAGCCVASQALVSTDTAEAVDPSKTCEEFSQNTRPVKQLLSGSAQDVGSLLFSIRIKSLFFKISDLKTNCIVNNMGCYRGCAPSNEELAMTSKTFLSALNSIDQFDQAVIDSSTNCISQLALMKKCTKDSSAVNISTVNAAGNSTTTGIFFI
jgi:hypothetical protein